MRIRLSLILALAIAVAPVAVRGGDVSAVGGSQLAICADCHGQDGASRWPDVPIIGGLSALTLEENLFAFRDGARPCRPTNFRSGDIDRPATDMCKIATDLSDDDIVAIAAYFAARTFEPATQRADPERAARGAAIHDRACHHCHGEGGSDPADHASILAGQWMPYLRMAFVNLRAGKRWMPKTMQSRLRNLSDEDVEDLVNYYASGAGMHRARADLDDPS